MFLLKNSNDRKEISNNITARKSISIYYQTQHTTNVVSSESTVGASTFSRTELYRIVPYHFLNRTFFTFLRKCGSVRFEKKFGS